MAGTAGAGRALVAEGLGTFGLVLVGVGGILMNGWDPVTTGLGFGLALVAMALVFGRVSGGHFNPAVSLAAAVDGRLSWARAGLYAAAQVGGALLAGAALWGLLHGFAGFSSAGDFGQNSFGGIGSGYSWWAALLLEALMTAVLVMVFLSVTESSAGMGAWWPVAVGMTLVVVHLVSLRATGTSVNPARSIGAGVFAGSEAIEQLWLFVLAPLAGGALAGATYRLLREPARATDPADVVDHPVPSVLVGTPTGAGAADPRPDTGYRPPADYQPQWSQPSGQHWHQPSGSPPMWEIAGLGRPPAGVRPLHPSERGDAGAGQPEGVPEWLLQGLPSPNEPYWSQQLDPEWGGYGDDGEDGRTQARPERS